MKDVSIKQIRAFLAVAATQNFSQAARNLHVSASALSLTIQDLEQRVGLRLFERTTRAVALTTIGAAFVPIADRLVSEFSKAIDDLVAFPSQQKGRVSVGAAASVIDMLLAPGIADLYNFNPGIAVHLVEDITQTLASRVVHGELDFGITTLWTKIESILAISLLDDRLGVVAPPDHPLAKDAGPISWKELRGHNLISLFSGAGIRARMELDVRIGQLLTQPIHEVSSVSALSALVRAGVGCAVIPALTAASLEAHRFQFRPLIKPISWRNLFLITAQGRLPTPGMRSLIQFLANRLDAIANIQHIHINSTFLSEISNFLR